MATEKNTVILYIDDDPDDVEMLQEAIRSINSGYQLRKAADGIEGLQLLQKMKGNGTLPCLIVLDLNMPGMDGRQTFIKIKQDDVLRSIPVVIFSTSSSSLDQLFFRDKNVEYITKPIQYLRLLEIAKKLLSMCN
ncbi:MAG: response regulator [Chitinophagaceae bacterium]|nr:MAG: response regulator [Chitinophagaceae bacterium]